MEDYEKHIFDVSQSRKVGYPISYCGEDISGIFYYQDAEHAVQSLKNFDSIIPCEKCKQKLIEILQK